MSKRLVPVICLLVLALVMPDPAHAASAPGKPWVEKAQRRLNQLSCDAGPADGKVGEHTRSAVIRFQSRLGLRQTGRLIQIAKVRLYAEDAPTCTDRPIPPRSGKGRRVVISQRQNWVWLVGAGGRAVAQSGMVDNTSVLRPRVGTVGSYCGRAARIKRNTDGHGLWLDNFVRFASCGIGFHRIPRYMSSGRQIHADWLVGTDLRTSHGCIRTPKAFSAKVWRFAHVGTRVHVIRG
ncbi:L,D-transpeptidase family protein [Nocardioides sp.]|uniref:L,D-transpeptidase family protein n=1 Tax=Nocardioides sp. TaxID=35761 RepID=UPI003D09B881